MAEVGRLTKNCVICGFDRSIDRAHLIPRRVVKGIRGMRRYEDYEGKHIIYLCKNHHFLFDTNRLNEEEWAVILPHYEKIIDDILRIANSNLIPVKKSTTNTENKNKVSLVGRWLQMITGRLIFRI